MIHLILACSWCDAKVSLESSFSDTFVIGDVALTMEHEGEPFAFCGQGCLDAALNQLGIGEPA